MTVSIVLREAITALSAAGIETPRVDAELLLAHVLGKDRRWLWTYPDAAVSAEQNAAFSTFLQKRLRREPLAYLLGEWEFYGRPFTVTPAVLIPRPETELLVEAVIAWVKTHQALSVVDVGVGSGAIAVTLACELPDARVTAIDLSPDALAIARHNAGRHGVEQRIRWLHGDLLQPLAKDRMDIVVANLPYIAEEEMLSLMPEVREYEPWLALCAPGKGYGLLYRVIDESLHVLPAGGLIALEVGMGQAECVGSYLGERHWENIRIIDDYAGIPRHVLGTAPATTP